LPVTDRTTSWLMWSGTLGDCPLEERLEATAQVGYGQLSVRLDDIAGLDDDSLTEVGRTAERHGVQLATLEAIFSWTDTGPRDWPGSAVDVADTINRAAAVGCDSITAIAARLDNPSIDRQTTDFAALCDLAAERGLAIDLEFSPLSSVSGISEAWQIVSDAGRPNGRILFDTWHFFRGDGDLATLATVPGPRIGQVQISDASSLVQGKLYADTMRHRRQPGEGDFDLVTVLQVLAEIDGLRSVGPEVISDENRARGPLEAARVSAEATDRLFETALGTRPR